MRSAFIHVRASVGALDTKFANSSAKFGTVDLGADPPIPNNSASTSIPPCLRNNASPASINAESFRVLRRNIVCSSMSTWLMETRETHHKVTRIHEGISFLQR